MTKKLEVKKKKNNVDKDLKHWAYGYGNESNAYLQTATTAKGNILTESNLENIFKNSPPNKKKK